MRIGVICDDYWHPGATIRQGLEPLQGELLQFDFIQDAALCSKAWMDEQDVIVLSKSNDAYTEDTSPWLTKELQIELQSFVESGKGLLALHSGTVGYRDVPSFFELIGGVFKSHPAACEVTMAYIGDAVPAFSGAAGFSVHDEHYFMEVIDEQIHVFMTSTSVHGTQPAGWVREQGKGRVCVLTPGHFLDVLRHPEYQAAISGALRWCGAAPYDKVE